MDQRVLFVAYQFPPVGGAGVQRITKFVKYLPYHGWRASVLTVANPSVPVMDDSLSADIPPGTIVRRAQTLEPGYALKAVVSAGGGARGQNGVPKRIAWRFPKAIVRRAASMVLQPDPQVLWMPDAIRRGVKLLREVPHAAIVATAPPFSSLMVGAALSRRTGVPLVLDYRDEWSISSAVWENKRLDPLSRRVQERMQRTAISRARAITVTTRASAKALEAVRDAARSRASVACIYNGFDPDDFVSDATPGRSNQTSFRLAYIGTLWNLASVEGLVAGLGVLSQREPELAGQIELIFAGRRTEQQQTMLNSIRGGPWRLVEHDYLDHRGALEVLRSSDALCVLLSDLPGADRVMPAKVFECMAARRTIFAISPRGEVWDVLRDYPGAHLLTPDDAPGIAAALAGEIRRWREGQSSRVDGCDISRFNRRAQAGQLAQVLNSLV